MTTVFGEMPKVRALTQLSDMIREGLINKKNKSKKREKVIQNRKKIGFVGT